MPGPQVDFALVSIISFFLFFVGLIFYLRHEDRREGYPLEDDTSGRVWLEDGFLYKGLPKTFILPNGQGTRSFPNKDRDRRPVAARRASKAPGSPLIPTGNPLVDGVGPAAYAERAKTPDLTSHGDPRIVPLRVARDFSLAKEDADPRGMQVIAADGQIAGTVQDVWIDRSEFVARYLEIATQSGRTGVLVPMTMALIDSGKRRVNVDAITAAQFASVPALTSGDQITAYEEERVVGYFGGGYLYATAARSEPLL